VWRLGRWVFLLPTLQGYEDGEISLKEKVHSPRVSEPILDFYIRERANQTDIIFQIPRVSQL